MERLSYFEKPISFAPSLIVFGARVPHSGSQLLPAKGSFIDMQGWTDIDAPKTLSQALDLYPDGRVAFTDYETGRSLLFSDVKRAAIAYVGALQSLGLRENDTVVCLLEDRLQLVPILVACFDLGLRLIVRGASSRHAAEMATSRRHPPKLIIGSARLKRFLANPGSPAPILHAAGAAPRWRELRSRVARCKLDPPRNRATWPVLEQQP